MITLRLDDALESKVEKTSSILKISKSELIRRSLVNYLEQYSKKSPWEVGKDLFGKTSSGRSDLSKNRKEIIKAKIQRKSK